MPHDSCLWLWSICLWSVEFLPYNIIHRTISELIHKFIHICMLLISFSVWQLRWVVVPLYDALYVPAHLWAKPTCWYMPRMNMEMIEDHSAVPSVAVLPRTRTVCVFMYIYTIEKTAMNEKEECFTDLFCTSFTIIPLLICELIIGHFLSINNYVFQFHSFLNFYWWKVRGGAVWSYN